MSEPAPIIRIEGVTKRFGSAVTALAEVTLEIGEGEFFALLGPSGCGKTTLLRILAGFESPSQGRVLIDGQDMAGVEPNRRPVNMVFQSYAVFPHMDVAANVGYGLRVTGVARPEIERRVSEALALVRLEGYERRKPDQLSGGQRQRVALARALIKRPRVLLLDEPLSALDAKLREAMQIELVRLQHAVGITFVIVTHDQHEGLSMAERIAVMDGGRVRQVAAPGELYEYPSCRFVADFIGKMNLFEGEAGPGEGATTRVRIDGIGELSVPGTHAPSGPIGVAVRPEKVRLHREAPGEGGIALEATIDTVAYHGSESHVYLRTAGGMQVAATVQNRSRGEPQPRAGEQRWVSWAPQDTLLLPE